MTRRPSVNGTWSMPLFGLKAVRRDGAIDKRANAYSSVTRNTHREMTNVSVLGFSVGWNCRL